MKLNNDLENLLQEIRVVHPDVYIRGGALRDHIIGLVPHDIDFFATGDYDDLLDKFDKSFTWATASGRGHGTFMFKHDDNIYELTIVDDIPSSYLRCDFTMNALIGDSLGIRDYCGGKEDIALKIIRRVDAKSIYNDPIRAIRAIRFKYNLGFTIEKQTYSDIENVMPKLLLCDNSSAFSISKYRSWNELRKVFELGNASYAITELVDLGLHMPFKSFEKNASCYENVAASLVGEKNFKSISKQFGMKVIERETIENYR
jgi:tRNA nucleotidyltransferase/poly(A) polymerase